MGEAELEMTQNPRGTRRVKLVCPCLKSYGFVKMDDEWHCIIDQFY